MSANAFLECGGRRSPTLYQDSWRRRFGTRTNAGPMFILSG